MYSKEQADVIWQMFGDIVHKVQLEKDMSQKWHDMAKTSSQKRLMLQKQNDLRRR